MTNNELFIELSKELLKLRLRKGYHFSISINGGNKLNCRTFISIFIHYYDEVLKNYYISVKEEGYKNKLQEIKDFINARVNKQTISD